MDCSTVCWAWPNCCWKWRASPWLAVNWCWASLSLVRKLRLSVSFWASLALISASSLAKVSNWSLDFGGLGPGFPPALFRGWAPQSAGELGPFGGTGSPPSVVVVHTGDGCEDGFPVSPLSELGPVLFCS